MRCEAIRGFASLRAPKSAVFGTLSFQGIALKRRRFPAPRRLKRATARINLLVRPGPNP
jgi:hypothetical protein